MTAAKKPAPKREIVLTRDHIHAGKPYKAGAAIEIPETLLPWFRKHNLIKGEESK